MPHLFWLAGQGGYGIQTAPAIAHLAARMISGGGVPPELEALGFTLNYVRPRHNRADI